MEMEILAWYGVLIIATILVQVTLAIPQFGLGYLASPRDEGRKATGMMGRLDRATTNNVTALAYFAPAVLLIQANGLSSHSTILAAEIFLVARLIYVPLYGFGVPWLRTLSFITGLLASLFLYYVVLV